MARDYYEILGVERTCTEVELKVSFRKLAMQHHPDRNPGDAEAEIRFKECNEAYSILCDPQKRAAYDRFGHDGLNGMNGIARYQQDAGDVFAEVFGDVFGEMFGGGRRGGEPARRARTCAMTWRSPWSRASSSGLRGLKSSSPLHRHLRHLCEGSGARPGTQPTVCGTSRRPGPRTRPRKGFFSIERTCPRCGGHRPDHYRRSLPRLPGHGARSERERTLQVRIPPGVDDGATSRNPAFRLKATRASAAGLGGTSIFSCRSGAARAVRARRAGPVVHRARAHVLGRARRRDRSPLSGRRRRGRGLPRQGQDPRGLPDRQGDRAAEGLAVCMPAFARPRRGDLGGRTLCRRTPTSLTGRQKEPARARLMRRKLQASPSRRHHPGATPASSTKPSASGTG